MKTYLQTLGAGNKVSYIGIGHEPDGFPEPVRFFFDG